MVGQLALVGWIAPVSEHTKVGGDPASDVEGDRLHHCAGRSGRRFDRALLDDFEDSWRLVVEQLGLVAKRLVLSEHTVNDHVKTLLAKSGAGTRQELLARIAGAA